MGFLLHLSGAKSSHFPERGRLWGVNYLSRDLASLLTVSGNLQAFLKMGFDGGGGENLWMVRTCNKRLKESWGGEKIQRRSWDIKVNMFSLTMLLMASLKLEKVKTWATHAISLDMLLALIEESENQMHTFACMWARLDCSNPAQSQQRLFSWLAFGMFCLIIVLWQAEALHHSVLVVQVVYADPGSLLNTAFPLGALSLWPRSVT